MRKIAIPAPISGGRAPQEVPGAAEDVPRRTSSVRPAADGRRPQPELNHARRAATALVDDDDGDLSGGTPRGRDHPGGGRGRHHGHARVRWSTSRWILPTERVKVSGSRTSTSTVLPTVSLTPLATSMAADSRRSGGQSGRAST